MTMTTTTASTTTEEDDTSPGNNQGSDPLDDGSTPEECDDAVDNDGNEGVDEGCPDEPGTVRVDSSVTMAGDGTPFTGEVESAKEALQAESQSHDKTALHGTGHRPCHDQDEKELLMEEVGR